MGSTVKTTLSYNPPPAIHSLQKGRPTLGTVVLLREAILALHSEGFSVKGGELQGVLRRLKLMLKEETSICSLVGYLLTMNLKIFPWLL